jgi:hypothetical protein
MALIMQFTSNNGLPSGAACYMACLLARHETGESPDVAESERTYPPSDVADAA